MKFDDLKGQTAHTPESTQAALVDFHQHYPKITEATWGKTRTEQGHSNYRWLAEYAGPLDGKVIVDLACGNGPLIREVLKLASPQKIYGVDLSEAELTAGRRETPEPQATFLHAPAQALPLESASIDVIFCHMAFMLFNPLEPVLDEIARVLKPGGTFAVSSAKGAGRPLLDQALKILKELLEKEVPAASLAGWGDARAKSATGIKQLFANRPEFHSLVMNEYSVWLRATPGAAAKFFPEFFYTTKLLSPAATLTLEEQWRALFETQVGPDGELHLEIPMLGFRLQKMI